VFPNAKNSPTRPPQYSSDLSISRSVSHNLRFPKAAPRFWHPAMPPAAVPETTIHKYRNSGLPEYEVWFAGQLFISSPSRDFVRTENRDKP